jgi:DHA1 family bicyclomycin/chloramphenicol resistance-like MFS transporter
MQPLGAIAGTGSAIVGATSMLISLTLGTGIGQLYDGTVVPLVAGFAVLSLGSIGAAWFAEGGELGSGNAAAAEVVSSLGGGGH